MTLDVIGKLRFIQFFSLILINLNVGAMGAIHTDQTCDLSQVRNVNDEAEGLDSYSIKSDVIVNPYFSKSLWNAFCPGAVATKKVTKSRSSELHALNIDRIIKCRRLDFSDQKYFQCSIDSDIWSIETIQSFQQRGKIATVSGKSAESLWSYWKQEPKVFNGSEYKRVELTIGTHYSLIGEDNRLVCVKTPISSGAYGYECTLYNDHRSRQL